MSPSLNTSMKPDADLPQARAVLPVASDLASEYASWVGARVSVALPGYRGQDIITGQLVGILKGTNGELVLKVSAADQWRSTDASGNVTRVPSLHLIPQSKVYSISREQER